MQRANIALALAATLAAGCAEVQELLGEIAEGSGNGHAPGHGTGLGGGPSEPPPASCGPSLDADVLYATIARDLSALDADDQPFQRYVTLANRFNAGECGRDLDVERAAIAELFNALSADATISRPIPIDVDELTFRVDLRDYAWDRELEVDQRTFRDGWEAALASSPYAIEYGGPDADLAKADTGTAVPLLNFDALADVTTRSSLYYAFVDVPASSDELLEDLGIDIDANLRDGAAVRAGTTRSRISRQDRIVERNALEVRAGFIWRAFDFLDESDVNIFDDPLSPESDASVALFTLPNGLLGYAMFDGRGQRVDESDILLDTNQNNFRATIASSCFNCHGATGIVPVVDEVREAVQSDAAQLDPDLVAAVERLYVPQAELDRLLEADGRSYTDARAQLGLGDGVPPLANTLIQFGLDLELQRMAGDLWVPEQAILDNLSDLSPLFSAPFAARGDFSIVYADAVCVVTETENRPIDCL